MKRHPKRLARTLAAAVWILLLPALGACGGDGERRERTLPPVPGNPAPAWEGETLDGTVVALANLEGEVVMLNIWATWCAPCIREMPGLEALHRHFDGQGLHVVGASVDRGSARGDVASFVDELDVTFTILLDPDQRVMNRFRTMGVPETFLIGRDGVIAHRWIGEFDPMATSVLERVRALLDNTDDA
jgi:peroxiredoxin